MKIEKLSLLSKLQVPFLQFVNILWAADMEALWQTLMIEIESFYLKRIHLNSPWIHIIRLGSAVESNAQSTCFL